MRLINYFFAARPLLHLPVWSVYLVSLKYHYQLSGGSVTLENIVIPLSVSMLAAGAYYLNQVYDIRSDMLNKKLGFIKKDLVSVKGLVGGFLVLSILALLVASFMSFFILFIFSQLFVLGYLYSAPPFRLKDRPVAGFFANAYAYGFLVPLAVMPELTIHNAGLLGWDNPVYFFLAVGAVYLLTTIPDKEGDYLTGKRTLAVLVSTTLVKFLAMGMLLLAAFVAYRSHYEILLWIAMISVIPIFLSVMYPEKSLELFTAKLPILLLTLLAGWYYPYYVVFVVVLILLNRLYYKKKFGLSYPELA